MPNQKASYNIRWKKQNNLLQDNLSEENSEKSSSRKSYQIDDSNPFFKDLSSTLDNVCLTDIESDFSDDDSDRKTENLITQKALKNTAEIEEDEELPSIISITEEISSTELQQVLSLNPKKH